MNTTTAPPERVPQGHANYRGDVRATFDDTRPYGPGYDGEYRWVVDAAYDPETDTTRVGFTKVPPPALDFGGPR